jgi:hypothetical protein
VGTSSALPVGAAGRALAIFTSGERLAAAERAPGGTFGPPATIAARANPLGASPVAVLRPGGGAVVAWTSRETAGLTARTREQAGPFGRAFELVYPKRLDSAAMLVQGRFLSSGRRELARAIPTADGRVMIAWGHLTRRQGLWRVVPGVARVAFSGDDYEVYGLAGGLREIGEIIPFVLADGSAGVAWSDDTPRGAGGRVHVAREGTPDAAEPPAPRVTFTPPRSRALKDADPLVLRVTCSAACDVYAQLADQPAVTAAMSLPGAGSRRLELNPVDAPIAPRGGGRMRVLVRSSAPGARAVTARTLTVRLRRAKVVFPPRVLGLAVTRDGDDVVVRWRTAKPARPGGYTVMAFDDDGDPVGSANPSGKARTSFGVRIRNARKAATVTVYAIAEHVEKYRRTTVKVPR